MSNTPSALEDSSATATISDHDVLTLSDPESSTPASRRKLEISLTDQTNLLPFRKVVVVFSSLSLCLLVSTLDSTIVATALPTISKAFNAGSIVSWVASSYLLTSTAFQPVYGRLSDIFGRKATLCLAMAIFMLGSLLAGFAPSIISLIIFRGIAGAGGGGIVGMAQIVMSDVVSLRDRGKYQGIIGGVVALGYALGPLIGGVLAEKATWRWCFWATVPVSAAAILVVVLVLPLKPVEGDFRRKLLVIDYFGVVLTLAGCTLVVLPLIWGGVTFPWSSAVVLAPLMSGMVVVCLFCLWEWRGAILPIVPMYIFRHSTVTGVYITMFINGIIFYSSLFYLPQFFQVALAYSPIRSGVFLLPVLVSQTLASFIAGQIISHTGHYRTTIHIGFAVWAVGCGCLSTVKFDTSKGLLVFYMLLTGTGAGQTLQTTTVAAQASVSRKDMSVVTAVRNFVRLLGGTLTLAIGATIINNSLRSSMTSLSLPASTIKAVVDNPTILAARLTKAFNSTSDPLTSLGISPAAADHILDGYTKGFRSVFILNACLAACATVVSIFMIHHKELIRGDDAQRKAEAEAELREHDKKDRYVDEKKDGPSAEEVEMTVIPGNSNSNDIIEEQIDKSRTGKEIVL